MMEFDPADDAHINALGQALDEAASKFDWHGQRVEQVLDDIEESTDRELHFEPYREGDTRGRS